MSAAELSRREIIGLAVASVAFPSVIRSRLSARRLLPMVGRVTDRTAVINLAPLPGLGRFRARLRWTDGESLDAAPRSTRAFEFGRGREAMEIPLDGLPPASPILYQLEHSPLDGPEVWTPGGTGRFRTQAGRGVLFRFAILADGHWGHQKTVAPGSARRWTGMQCVRQVAADGPFDFAIDLGDGPLPIDARSAVDALECYVQWRELMQEITSQSPVYFLLGNHEQEAGFYQRAGDCGAGLSNGLARGQLHQRWCTEARLRCVPNPRGDTYPEGGEGAKGFDSEPDWRGERGEWSAGDWGPLQNFYAWSWGDALFVALDVLRYTMVGQTCEPNSPAQWTLGPTQMRWLEQTLAQSNAKWKFILAHHQVGGGLIDKFGEAITPNADQKAYARGAADEATRPDVEQARIHDLMRKHGVQFFIYGHDHVFYHGVKDGVHYLCCGRPTFLNNWIGKQGMRDSYGDVLARGRDKPGTRALYNVLGYTRFSVDPDAVTVEWIRTGFSFKGGRASPARAERDWLEGWGGREFAVGPDGSIQVDLPPTDVEAVRALIGAHPARFGEPPPGESFYRQPESVRPERHSGPLLLVQGVTGDRAVVDAVPQRIYSFTLRADGSESALYSPS